MRRFGVLLGFEKSVGGSCMVWDNLVTLRGSQEKWTRVPALLFAFSRFSQLKEFVSNSIEKRSFQLRIRISVLLRAMVLEELEEFILVRAKIESFPGE